PVLVQIPVFFALYKVLFVTIEMRHQPGLFWVKDLSAPDHFTIVNLFGLIPWDPPGFLAIGLWPILMALAMFLQQRLNPPAAEPVQQKIMMAMPFVFMFIMARFPAGLVMYWTWNTILSAIQQWVIMRQDLERHGRAGRT
ncbi:MAG: membrane protein insertase YidC, partial [Alphaproteobacteria bacterium]